MGFAATAVEALFEQAHFGLEFIKALLLLALLLLETGLEVGVAAGELFFEFGFAEASALVERLVTANLVASLPEEELARVQTAGWFGGQRVAEVGVGGFPKGLAPSSRRPHTRFVAEVGVGGFHKGSMPRQRAPR
jgi:hypothetical protein